MPVFMPVKTPGKLNSPPPQAEFDALPLARWCAQMEGVYYRLHGLNQTTGKPWPPVHFSQRGTSRFDPAGGPGTFCVGETLAGVLLEVFDDSWGDVNSPTRSLTRTQLDQWWLTLVAVPSVNIFLAHGINLSKIGTWVSGLLIGMKFCFKLATQLKLIRQASFDALKLPRHSMFRHWRSDLLKHTARRPKPAFYLQMGHSSQSSCRLL